MTREQFLSLHEIISDTPSMKSETRGRDRIDTRLQLMVFLSYVGSTKKFFDVAKSFHLSKGGAISSYHRVLSAILSIRDQYIKWPDEQERNMIQHRFSILTGFPNCVGVIDSTSIDLEERPVWCGADFFTRKSRYSVNSLIVSDDICNILYVYCGWPGSTHDNRVWRHCKLYKQVAQHFSPGQYLLSDSAFNPGTNIVPAFKSLPGQVLPDSKVFFNARLSSARIKIEHTNGLLKERFPILTRVDVLIKKDRDVAKIVQLVTACCVLHNMLQDVPFMSIEELEKIMKTCPVDEDDPEFHWNHDIHDDGDDPEFHRNNDIHDDGDIRRNQLYDFILFPDQVEFSTTPSTL
jgi:hypothetical protein